MPMAKPAKPVKPAGPKVVKPSSIATLAKRAKEGDAAALHELVTRTGDEEQEVVIAAATAIAAVATQIAHETLVKLALESPNKALRFAVMRALDKAIKKHDHVLELVINLCADPRVDADDYPICLLANLVYKTPTLATDPRVIGSLRRAVDATHPYAQDGAVAALVRLKDTSSLPRIVALLERTERSNNLWMWVGKAMLELGGGSDELTKLRAARERARPAEQVAVDEAIEKLAAHVAGS